MNELNVKKIFKNWKLLSNNFESIKNWIRYQINQMIRYYQNDRLIIQIE